MNINATLFGQAITFAIFIWFTMKYVWPPIMNAIETRQKTIADGLAAAKKGEARLDEVQHEVHQILSQAREKSNEMIDHANQRADEIIQQAQDKAIAEGQRLLHAAQARIDQEMSEARVRLRAEVVDLALRSTEKLLNRTLDDKGQREFLEKVVGELN